MISKTVWACVLAGVSAACTRPDAAMEPQVVRTAAVEPARGAGGTRYAGVVEPDTQVDLAFRVGGYVDQIMPSENGRELQEGDRVTAGATLARLRTAEYEARRGYAQAAAHDAAASLAALKAQLDEMNASFQQAAGDLERARALFAEKAMTKADLEAAQARHDASVARRAATAAQVVAQEARVEGAGAELKEAALALSDTSLVAPFSGVVIAKHVSRGSLVAAGTSAFVIADTRAVRVSFGVPDLALKDFKPGDALRVVAEAAPDREFKARVSVVAAAADPTSRAFTVQARIPNADHALKVGMVATLGVGEASVPPGDPSIPLSAVVKSPTGYGVYVVEAKDGTDRARLRPITLGAVRGNSVAVTAGLALGERVVATAGLQLADGDPVRPLSREGAK